MGGDSRQGCGNALLLQGHRSWPQTPVWDGSLAEPSAGPGYLGFQKTRKQNMLQLTGRRQQTQLRQLPLSLHVTCSATFPTHLPQQRRVSSTSSFPAQNPHSLSLSGLIKTTHFLSLNPDFHGNRMFFTSLYVISDQNFTAARDRSH